MGTEKIEIEADSLENAFGHNARICTIHYGRFRFIEEIVCDGRFWMRNYSLMATRIVESTE